jgi:hypothetical protein
MKCEDGRFFVGGPTAFDEFSAISIDRMIHKTNQLVIPIKPPTNFHSCPLRHRVTLNHKQASILTVFLPMHQTPHCIIRDTNINAILFAFLFLSPEETS